jgi:hypothetical protein
MSHILREFEPADPLAAIQRIKQIPEGGSFKISAVRKKASSQWYQVTAIDKDNETIGSGWINSIALPGQDLQ